MFNQVMHQLPKISLSLFLFCCLGNALAQDDNAKESEAESGDLAGSTVFDVARDKPYKFLTFTLENDLFVGDDDGYTNGIGFSFGRGPVLEFSRENLPFHLHWLTKNLYISNMPNKARGVAHMFFQRMQTPEDITVEELQENDVPYVGFAAVQSALFAWDKDRSDQLSLFLGVVGPAALGEEAQKLVHSVIGADEPLGWDNQIENELVFRVQARQTRKLLRNYSGRFGYDVLGLGEASLGTIQSDLAAGFAVRWGTNLEFSHATFNLQADRQVNALALSERNDFFVYLGALAGYVANDVLIDGNTFEDSHSVPLEHFRNQIAAGVIWKRNRFAYVFQFSSFSARTTITSSRDTFGAVSITYPFRYTHLGIPT